MELGKQESLLEADVSQKLDDSRYRCTAEASASIGIVLDFGMPPKIQGGMSEKNKCQEAQLEHTPR